MLRRLGLVPLTCALAFAMAGECLAQVRVRTEAIKPSAQSPAQPSAPGPQTGTTAPNSDAAAKKQGGTATVTGPPPEIVLDASRLPEPVARTREKILAAARSGDLNKLAAVMQASGQMPIFSLNDDKDPIPFWKANYPDSDGVEVLSIVIEILEAGFVHADQGTPQDMYVWPYFARKKSSCSRSSPDPTTRTCWISAPTISIGSGSRPTALGNSSWPGISAAASLHSCRMERLNASIRAPNCHAVANPAAAPRESASPRLDGRWSRHPPT
jgi:hypothetical protein